MSVEAGKRMNKLSMIEQSLYSLLSQKQTLQTQIMESESASEELKKTRSSYQIIGNLMVEKKPEELRKKLGRELEELKKQLKACEEREQKIREQAGKLQEELLKEMEQEESKEEK